MRQLKTCLFILLFIPLFFNNTFAQFDEFHPELNWFTIKGNHVDVHYHQGAERTARTVLKIADEVWEPVTSLYEYEPSRVHYVIKDIDDYSNGATYFFDNKIEIWTSALDFDLRGAHNWLRNVISHEFTHMVQIQAALKTPRAIPAVYLQWLNYEDKRRPDVLYGYPNVIMSYPLAFINVPAWLAEGTAQYMRKEFDYDRWDAHRDMIMRSYALDSNMLSWNQMGVFGKTSLGNESVYNSGYALTKYIAQKYGEDKLRIISKKLGKFFNFTVDAAIEDAIGITGNQLYNEWKTFTTKDYTTRTEKIRANLIAGEKIADEGFGNFYPSFSSDGKKIYYISNQTSDYFSPTSLFAYNIKTKTTEESVGGVRSTYSFIPGTPKLLYSKLSADNPDGYNVHDLFTYDTLTEKETRHTFNLRANHPSISHKGDKIVFLFQKDGTTNLGITDTSWKNVQSLTHFENGEQVFNPKFSDDDSYIVFDYSYHQGRDIARVDVDGKNYGYVFNSPADERNPYISKTGLLYYSSDKTGIYNIYTYNFKTKENKQLTNVTGGAFMPSADVNGNLTYAGYTSAGYKIFYLEAAKQSEVASGMDYVKRDNPPLDESKPNGDISKFNIEKLKNFDDYSIPDYKPTKYNGVFSSMTVFPFVRFDNYSTTNNSLEKIKPGVYLASSDMLNRYSIFAGASLNSRMERDIFFQFQYRNKLPLLFNLGLKPELSLDIYNVSRKANVDISIDEFPPLKTNVIYNLFEVDLSAKHKFINRYQEVEFRYIFSRYTATIESFLIPIPGGDVLYPTNDDTYLISSNFQFTYNFKAIKPARDEEINPIGMDLEFRYNYELNRYNPDGKYEVSDGTLVPLYSDFNFHRVELNTSYHYPLFKSHTLNLKVRGGAIFGNAVPDFFDFYLGGLVGMKAYPFYGLSGNKLFWMNLSYRFPLFKEIDARWGIFYLDKIYFSLYGDYGNAWTGDINGFNDFKRGAGAEVRFALNSFYLFPTNIFLNASYGFDGFERTISAEKVVFGKEWRFYAGILFGFDF